GLLAAGLRWARRASDRFARVCLLPLTQHSHSFFKVRGVVVEVVRAVVARGIANVVEIVRLRGIQSGVDRTLARIPDRARWQSRKNSRVVERAPIDVAQINLS